MNLDSFQSRTSLAAAGASYQYYRLGALAEAGLTNASGLPFSLKILLENLLRYEDGRAVKKRDIERDLRREMGTRRT